MRGSAIVTANVQSYQVAPPPSKRRRCCWPSSFVNMSAGLKPVGLEVFFSGEPTVDLGVPVYLVVDEYVYFCSAR
jgi:hypothetical protein